VESDELLRLSPAQSMPLAADNNARWVNFSWHAVEARGARRARLVWTSSRPTKTRRSLPRDLGVRVVDRAINVWSGLVDERVTRHEPRETAEVAIGGQENVDAVVHTERRDASIVHLRALDSAKERQRPQRRPSVLSGLGEQS
jgi:hypothetical protein